MRISVDEDEDVCGERREREGGRLVIDRSIESVTGGRISFLRCAGR